MNDIKERAPILASQRKEYNQAIQDIQKLEIENRQLANLQQSHQRQLELVDKEKEDLLKKLNYALQG
jgi:hypothetical protein